MDSPPVKGCAAIQQQFFSPFIVVCFEIPAVYNGYARAAYIGDPLMTS